MMFEKLLRNKVAKVSVGFIVMLVVAIYVGASILPSAINTWIGNGTVIGSGGTPNATLNPLWVTVGGIVLVAIVLMAYLRASR